MELLIAEKKMTLLCDSLKEEHAKNKKIKQFELDSEESNKEEADF